MLLRRFISMLLVLFCVVSMTFLLMRFSPGGPFDAERKLSPAIEHQLLLKYRLEGPLFRQYIDYWRDLLHGDFRISTKYRNRSVTEILSQTLPVTFTLGALAFVIALGCGIFMGSIAAIHPNSSMDHAILLFTLVAISLPAFILGPVFILIFSIWLHWLPVGGWGSPLQLLLPSITLALPFMAVIARLLRDSLRETLQENFILTAQAKGFSRSEVVYRHALRIALLPVVSYSGPLAANLLTGSIVVETIFNIPGAGNFFVNAVLNRDGFLLCGAVIVYCVLLVIFNFLVDVAYRFLDPRIENNF
ncbi:MAG: ABC transporter permease [Chthoniobacterales bacterium]